MVCFEALARLATESTLNVRQPLSASSARVASRMAERDSSLREGPLREVFFTLASVDIGLVSLAGAAGASFGTLGQTGKQCPIQIGDFCTMQ